MQIYDIAFSVVTFIMVLINAHAATVSFVSQYLVKVNNIYNIHINIMQFYLYYICMYLILLTYIMFTRFVLNKIDAVKLCCFFSPSSFSYGINNVNKSMSNE